MAADHRNPSRTPSGQEPQPSVTFPENPAASAYPDNVEVTPEMRDLLRDGTTWDTGQVMDAAHNAVRHFGVGRYADGTPMHWKRTQDLPQIILIEPDEPPARCPWITDPLDESMARIERILAKTRLLDKIAASLLRDRDMVVWHIDLDGSGMDALWAAGSRASWRKYKPGRTRFHSRYRGN